VDFFQTGIGDVSIDLSGGDGRMAKHNLHAADVGSIGQKIGSERMAESVRMDIFNDAGFGGVIFNNPLDAAGSETERIGGTPTPLSFGHLPSGRGDFF